MTRRALLVGVPKTRYRKSMFAPLPGSRQDVAAMRELVRDRGFKDVAAPPASKLSAAYVKECLTNLVTATGPGDLSVFYFSGHGWQYRDVDNDEKDHLDEAIVCEDLPIEDDWFRKRLWPKANEGARFLIIVDACHSESVLAAPALFLADLPIDVYVPAVRAKSARIARTKMDGWWRLTLAACKEKENALAFNGGDVSAVTAVMRETLAGSPNLSHRKLWGIVAAEVKSQFGLRGAGTPIARYRGPDDSLLNATAFTTGEQTASALAPAVI